MQRRERGVTLFFMPDISADFAQFACLTPEAFEWLRSPGGEVERVMLDRVGGEVAVATSLVRYPPGSTFPAHEHGLGEEYLVLEGEFGDEHGRYPPGTYVRNPPGSRHTPFSDPGCVIWVKLRQFHPDDDRQVVTRVSESIPVQGTVATELHRFEGEVVTVMAVGSGSMLALPEGDHVQEVLIIEGAVQWRDQQVGERGWLRVPAGEGVSIVAEVPCRLLHKTRPSFALPGTT
jgi:hypothetical protein